MVSPSRSKTLIAEAYERSSVTYVLDTSKTSIRLLPRSQRIVQNSSETPPRFCPCRLARKVARPFDIHALSENCLHIVFIGGSYPSGLSLFYFPASSQLPFVLHFCALNPCYITHSMELMGKHSMIPKCKLLESMPPREAGRNQGPYDLQDAATVLQGPKTF